MAPWLRHPLAPWLWLAALLLAPTTLCWAQEAELSDEAKLAALEEAATQKAAEEQEARLLAEAEEATFQEEEAKMKALEEDAQQKHAEQERLRLAAEEEAAKAKAAEAHLKELELQAAKNAAEEESARQAAEAEQATFAAEQAKSKVLHDDVEQKSSELRAIEQEEARLMNAISEKNAGYDMTATVSETAAEVASMAASMAPLPPQASGRDIFSKIANAKAAGLDPKEFAAVADKAQRKASEELKQAATATHHTRRLKTAFDNAAEAGVSEVEQSAHRSAVIGGAEKRLATAQAAFAANSTLTHANVKELAHALSSGIQAGLNRTTLHSAKQVYKGAADVALRLKDLRHAETLVMFADEAQVSIPGELQAWVRMLNSLRDARKVSDDSNKLPTLLSMITSAKAMGLPNNTELAAVEQRVQAWSSTRLNDAVPKGSNMSMTEAEFDALLQEVGHSHEAGASSYDLTQARAKVLSFAKSALEQACAVQPKQYNAGRLKKAFVDAESAGVPEAERVSARRKVVAGIESELSSLMNGNGTRHSKEFVSEFAQAMALAQRFAIDGAMQAKGRTFYQKLAEGALAENNVPYAEALVEFQGSVGVVVPDTLRGYVKTGRQIKEARTTPDDRRDLLPQLLGMVTEARHFGLSGSNGSDLAIVEGKVHTWAAADLKEAMLKAGNSTSQESFNLILEALDQAKTAGLPSYSLAEAASKASSWATRELELACTKPYDSGKIKTAFVNAERAGVPEATRDSANAGLIAGVEKQLLLAFSNATNATKRNKDFVSELASSMFLASRFKINEKVKMDARRFYEQQCAEALELHDFYYAELLVNNGPTAGANVPAELRTWIGILKQLKEAESMPAERIDQLPALLDMITSARSIGLDKNMHLAAVEAKAKQMAHADLKAEL